MIFKDFFQNFVEYSKNAIQKAVLKGWVWFMLLCLHPIFQNH
jgi:hypothetical protein